MAGILFVGSEMAGHLLSDMTELPVTYTGTIQDIEKCRDLVIADNYKTVIFDLKQFRDDFHVVASEIKKMSMATQAQFVFFFIGGSKKTNIVVALVEEGFHCFVLNSLNGPAKDELQLCLAGYADDVAERFQRIVDAKTGTKSAVAIHWNRKGNSYHMHIVCSENEELPEPEPVKVREPLKRDTYFNAAGKRSSKKECVDAETKQLLPGCSVIRKGQTQPDQLEVRRFAHKNRKISSQKFLNELKQDFANELNDLMYEYGHDNDYFVVANFRTPDNVYLKQLSKPKGLPEQTCERIDLYNQAAKEYNEIAGALTQHYPEAAHTDELEQIAQAMNRKSAADRDGFVGAVREITKALQMQFAAARAAAARPKVSSVADFASRYRDRSNLDAADHNLNRVLRYFKAAMK